ncbi:hypothetical protein AWB94_31525 [Mycolicibacterium canariasense]|nr:alpha/beta hydrolase [Mycolicibacterium canariasense]ORU95394.1 hypothetical protein AWB94_31525 [Mycolicibacterium canariasense]
MFVHGAGHTADCWDEHFLDYFADRGYRAIAVDLHGAGPSASIADHVDRVHAVAGELLSAPILIGHATGGFIVQHYLRRHGIRAAALVASSPSPDHLRSMMRCAPLRDLIFGAGTPESLVEACYALKDDAALRSLCADRETAQAPKLRLIRSGDTLPRVLVMDGTDDSWDPSVAQSLAAEYHTRAELMPGMQHDMMLGPGWMAAAERIRRWIDTLHLRIRAPEIVIPARNRRIRVVGAPVIGNR